MSIADHNYQAYGPGFRYASEIPLHARRNKSGKGIHFSEIRDQGECGPTLCCWIEYSVKHTPALNDMQVDLGRVLEVDEVYVTPVRYGDYSTILKHNDVTLPPGPHWVDTANVLLSEHTGIRERIEEEVRLTLQ